MSDHLFLPKAFGDIIGIKYLFPNVDRCIFKTRAFGCCDGAKLIPKLLKSLFTEACFRPPSLWHPSHPFQLGAVSISKRSLFAPHLLYTFGSFLEVKTIIALVGIELTIIQLKNSIAYLIKEIPIVRHHKERCVSSRKVALKPFHDSGV